MFNITPIFANKTIPLDVVVHKVTVQACLSWGNVYLTFVLYKYVEGDSSSRACGRGGCRGLVG